MKTMAIVFGALAVAAASPAGAALVITEVAEGTSGNFKYVEIKNTGGSSVDLSSPQVSLRRYANGSGTPATVNLAGTIPAGGYFLIANNQADLNTVFGVGIVTASQVDSTVVNPNGDDCFDLYDGTTVVDGFASDWAGSGTTGGSDAVRAACNGAYFRVLSAYPNDGDWGGANNVAPPADGGTSPNGYWKRVLMTASNGNATTICTPFAAGGGSGAELPVEVDSFVVE